MKPNVSKSMLLIAVILMDLLAGMEFDLFVPSFPELQAQFNLSPFLVETLLSINFIGFCLSACYWELHHLIFPLAREFFNTFIIRAHYLRVHISVYS